MTIDVLRPSELTSEHLAAWRAFQAADPDLGSPFLTLDWVMAVTRALGDRAARIAVAHQGGRPHAFLAVRPGPFTALPVGAPMSDYQAVIAAPDATVDLPAMLKALGVARYDFTHVPLSQKPFAAGFRGRQTSWCVDLAGGWDGYVAELKAKKSSLLKDVGSRWRRMEREVGEVVFTPVSDNLEDFERLLHFKRFQYQETGQTDVLARGWTQRLMRDMLTMRGEHFGSLFSTLHVGGKLASGHFGLYANGVLHAWFLAHDCDLGRHSPGMVILGELLKHLANEGGWREFDFGPGDYPFKLRMANRGRELGYGFVGRPSPASAVRAAAYWMRSQAEAAPLGAMSALPGKAMRRWDVIRALG